MAESFTLEVINSSTQSGSFCVFQEPPNSNIQGLKTIAWLVKKAHPTTTLRFNWDVNYNFVWTKTTGIGQNAVVKTSQTWKTNLTSLNQVKYEYTDGAYTFNDPTNGGCEGSLYIDSNLSVVSNDSLVGIGMGGKATFLMPSQPNMKLVLTPHKPKYWLAFGHFVEGEAIEISAVCEDAFELDFNNSDHLVIEFCDKNKWHQVTNKAKAAHG